MKRYTLSAVFFLSLLCPAWADFSDTYADWIEYFGLDPNAGRSSFLILLIPAGGKYESMGTAYTAMTDDLGFIDSNPAVSSYLNNTELMVLHNNWISDSSYVESVAYTNRVGKLGYGLAGKLLWMSFDAYNDWGQNTSTGAYTESVVTVNASYNFFRNYYFDGLSLGASFKTGYRGISQSLVENQNALSLMGDIGAISRFNFLKFYASRDKNFSVGLSVKNIGTELISNPDPLPSSVTAGIAYSPLRILTLAFDVNQPFYLNGEDAELISYAFGMDLHATSFLSVQSGFLLKTGKPRLTLGSEVKIQSFSIYTNYTLDLTTQFEAMDRMSVSLKWDLGDRGRTTIRDKVQDLYLEGLEAYAKGRYNDAIALWEECLQLDEEFIPAQEMIDTTKKSLDLEEEMKELQRVE